MQKQKSKQLMLVTGVEKKNPDDGKLKVYLCGRSMKGKRVVKEVYGTEPYFFVDADEFNRDLLGMQDMFVERVDEGFESYDGKELVKVVCEAPTHVSDVRKKFRGTYEADVVYERRCTADYNMSGYVRVPGDDKIRADQIEDVDSDEAPNIDPKVMFCDIEVREPDTFDEDFIEDAPKEVTAICSYDTYEGDYTLFCLDPELEVDPEEIRPNIESNWEGYDDFERVTDVDINFKRFSKEDELLQAFVNYCDRRAFDIYTGWNFVDFDIRYLTNRMHQVDSVYLHAMSDVGYVGGRNPSEFVDGVPTIDQMAGYCDKLSYGEWESKSLDYVSDSELGVGKLDGGDVGYESDRTKYMAYNIVDVMLSVELNEISGFISFWMMLSDICSIPPYLVGTEMYEVEGFLFGNREDDEILPDREDDKEMDMISGGFVLPPYDGLKEWVGVIDLKSLYPSSMISCNISRETMTYDEDEADIIVPDIPLNYEEAQGDKITEEDISWELGEGNCVGFNLDEQGIMPKYVTMLFDERAEKKAKRNQADPDSTEYERFNQQQRAVKVVMNSFFGVSDHPYFRLAEDGIGAAITGASRYVSWLGVQAIESEGYDLVYGDTDSLLMSLTDKENIDGDDLDPAKAAAHLEILEQEVNQHLDQAADDCGIPAEHPHIGPDMHGTDRHLWKYEAEKVYKRFLQTGVKKRYAGKIKWKEGKMVDKTDITGYETEKSDSSPITQEVQKGVIDRALEGKGFDELTGYLQTEIGAIKEDLHPLRKVAFPSVLNKPPEEYPNRPIKRATQYSNQHMHADWSEGDTPWYVYVNQTPYGKPNSDVVAIDWTRESLPSGYELDGEAHIEKTIQQPIEPIAKSLGYSWSELRTGKEEQSVCENTSTDSPDEIFG